MQVVSQPWDKSHSDSPNRKGRQLQGGGREGPRLGHSIHQSQTSTYEPRILPCPRREVHRVSVEGTRCEFTLKGKDLFVVFGFSFNDFFCEMFSMCIVFVVNDTI